MSQRGDESREEFWRALIAVLNPRLRAYLRRMRCNEEDIEEIVWDIWEEVANSESSGESTDDQWVVVESILRRNCARRARQWRHERPLDPDEQIQMCHDETSLDLADLRTWANQLLGELPPQQRLAVDLRCRWGWPYWAVAAALDAAEPTARVHVARGLHQLRTLAQVRPPPINA
jgi:RNA polymerase sigma factor (sigma-70 family)